MHRQIQSSFISFPRRGVTIIYVAVAMAVFAGLVSLAVDYGRVQVAKVEMERAAEAASRFGVRGVADGTAVNKALLSAADNTVDGNPIQLLATDVQCGTWNPSAGVFTQTAVNPMAVQVTIHRAASRGNAISTPFAMLLGRQSIDLTAVSVSTITFGINTTIQLKGTSDPWLAGEPSGTTANYTNQGWYDSAPNESPALASGLTIKPGNTLNFNFVGSVSNQPAENFYGPDGNTNWIINNYAANGVSEHGIADLKAPISSIVAVFLDDNVPDGTPAPTPLDFTSSSSRDFSSISPLLKQPFYVGDGMRADGITPQNFVVPPGATRLYFGIMDGQQWSDNSGSGSMSVNTPPNISTVK